MLNSYQFGLFFRLLAAHICGDVITYSPTISQSKRSPQNLRRTIAIVVHCFIHILFIWIWLWDVSINIKLFASIYFFIVHSIIDSMRVVVEDTLIKNEDTIIIRRKDVFYWLIGRSTLEMKEFMNKYFIKWILINVFDQVFHFLSIFLFVYFLIK